MRRRLILSLFACLGVLTVAGCSSGSYSEPIYTYSQKTAGNIAASDALGAGLSQHDGVQTAFVPDDN
jgi:hypothetical protein